jgi:MoaA/NifB/PqqE/SkfB family radical SAM enzyme
VSGLLTDGERIADSDYLNGLLQTGLDHIMIVLDPALDNAWRGLENAIAGDVYTAVHLTITSDNSGDVRSVLDRLAQVGVHAISLSATSENLDENLKAATDRIAELDIPLVWDLPVPYSAHNPVALEVEQSEMPEKAGRAWLYVEPDGDVLPAQGINELVGNLLTESWDTVWERTRRKLTE